MVVWGGLVVILTSLDSGLSVGFVTDSATGHFRVGPYPPGWIRMFVSRAGLSESQLVGEFLIPGDGDLNVGQLFLAGYIAVAVSQGALREGRFRVYSNDGSMVLDKTLDRGISADFDFLPGSYSWVVFGASDSGAAGSLCVQPHGRNQLEIDFPPRYPVRLILRSNPGIELQGLNLILCDSNGRERSAFSVDRMDGSNEPRLEMEIGEGEWTLRTRDRRGGDLQGEIRVGPTRQGLIECWLK